MGECRKITDLLACITTSNTLKKGSLACTLPMSYLNCLISYFATLPLDSSYPAMTF